MSVPPTNSAAPGDGRWHRQWPWAAATLLLIGCGIGVSVFAAEVVARHDADKAGQIFESSSRAVATSLQQVIEQEEDLAADAGGMLADPDLTATSFREWAAAARVLQRYPEMDRMGALVVVEHAELPAFAKRAVADPTGTLAADGTFEVLPGGARPFYCLVAAGIAPGSSTPTPAGFDYCANAATREPLLLARDSARGAYTPYTVAGETWLAIHTPIYHASATQATVEERRAAFAGWVATLLDPTTVLDRVLRDHPALAVEMRYQRGATDVVFTSGTTTPGLHSATTDLHNGWTIRTFGVVRTGGVTDGQALAVLLGGIAMSLLLGLLMFVLATGRERARRQLVQRTSQLHHQALHDALTGLPNRALLTDRIEQMLVRDRRNHTSGAALFLDLDDFKNVNDTLGHAAGDRLLVAVATRLASTLRGVDTIARMGGDEFVVLVDGASLDVAPELVAQRLLDIMSQPFELDDASMPLTVNISIGIASGDRDSAGDLLRDADVALYQAKGAGKNRYEIFDPEMQSTISRRTDLEFDLRSALASNQYRLVYQPIYHLDDLTVIGVEALLRWDHPTRGPISPAEFIPILEQTGQIREVGRWVLHEACQQMATWHSRGDTLDISVNVSARQLDHDGIADDIRDALDVSGLAASALIIEVTETALMHNVDATARRLHAIKDLGVRVAVDDFGTGYSSLAYLRQFPVDCLKIDQMFTSAVSTSPESKALVGTLVQLGRDLGLITLAEGVETTVELDILRGAHVDQAQGFLMARPLDPEALETQHLAAARLTATTTTPS
ncbi:MAG: EAL domain-containing protein [Actinomycetota bacterium]|nr:EAL domain-containing protein [Actinomycetota bacterium]